MFKSQTYGKLELQEIPEKILIFFNKMKEYDTPMQVVVGTDSQNFSDTKIVNVVAILCEGHGGIYFYQISHVAKIMDVRQKLYTETGMSLEIADALLKIIEESETYHELYEKTTFTIHVDAGRSEKGKTKDLIPAIVGWIKAQGFECEVKPDSFVASTIADRISK